MAPTITTTGLSALTPTPTSASTPATNVDSGLSLPLRLCGALAISLMVIVFFAVAIHWLTLCLGSRQRRIAKVKSLPRQLVLPTTLNRKRPAKCLPSATRTIPSILVAEATPRFISVPVDTIINRSTRWVESFGTAWRQSVVDIESASPSAPEPVFAVAISESKTATVAAAPVEDLFVLNFCTSLSTIASACSQGSLADTDDSEELGFYEIYLWIQSLKWDVPAIVLVEPTVADAGESPATETNVDLCDTIIGTTLRGDAFLELPSQENKPVATAEVPAKRRRRESAAPGTLSKPRPSSAPALPLALDLPVATADPRPQSAIVLSSSVSVSVDASLVVSAGSLSVLGDASSARAPLSSITNLPKVKKVKRGSIWGSLSSVKGKKTNKEGLDALEALMESTLRMAPPPDFGKWATVDGVIRIKVRLMNTAEQDLIALKVAEGVSLAEFVDKVSAKVGYDVKLVDGISVIHTEEAFASWVGSRVRHDRNYPIDAFPAL